jgi:hypothetical protein
MSYMEKKLAQARTLARAYLGEWNASMKREPECVVKWSTVTDAQALFIGSLIQSFQHAATGKVLMVQMEQVQHVQAPGTEGDTLEQRIRDNFSV